MILAKGTPLDRSRFARCRRVPIARGAEASFGSPNTPCARVVSALSVDDPDRPGRNFLLVIQERRDDFAGAAGRDEKREYLFPVSFSLAFTSRKIASRSYPNFLACSSRALRTSSTIGSSIMVQSSRSSSGVQMTGGSYPSSLQIDSILPRTSAFAMCFKFHVSR